MATNPSTRIYYSSWKWVDAPGLYIPPYFRIESVFPNTTNPGDANHGTIRTAWGYSKLSPCSGWGYSGGYDTFEVKRKIGETEEILGTTENNYFEDSGIDIGTTYQYAVRGISYEQPLPSYVTDYECPNCSNDDPSCYHRARFSAGPWSSYVTVTTNQVSATENQAVDSRIDTRKDDDVLVNFDFQDRVYRGGLFVGARCSPDESRVSRSFLKFEIPTLPTGAKMWMGSLNTYYTCSVPLQEGENEVSATVGCQYLDNDSWVDHGSECITWSKMQTYFPSFNPTNAIETVTVSGQESEWCRWDSVLNDLLWKVTAEDRFLTYGLALKDEPNPLQAVPDNSHGWAYFAKKEYAPAIGPCITYAYSADAPTRVIDLTLSASTVQGGNTVTGTIWLNAPTPTGGYRAFVLGSCPVSGPKGGVLIPAGEHSCDFTISTGVVYNSTDADVYVVSSGYLISRQLTITE